MKRNSIMTSKFKWQVSLVWLALMIGFIWFIAKFDLDMDYVWQKLPFLAGLHLSPDGFIQGVPLTIYVCVIAMLASVIIKHSGVRKGRSCLDNLACVRPLLHA